MTLGEKVSRLRAARGWTQAQLARHSGLGASTLAHIERGSRLRVQPQTVRALAAAFGVPDTYFYSNDPREYVKVRLATLDAVERARLEGLPGSERLAWLLSDLEAAWGEAFSPTTLARRMELAPEALGNALAGRFPISAYMLEKVGQFTGAPLSFFTSAGLQDDPEEMRRYREAIELAARLGLAPEALLEQVKRLGKG